MIELYTKCPNCAESERDSSGRDIDGFVCEMCWNDDPPSFGYVLLTPQTCPGHEMVVRVVPISGYWKIPYDHKQRVRTQMSRSCRYCGVKSNER